MNNPMQHPVMRAFMQAQASRDPRAQMAQQIIQGKSPADLQQIAMNMAKERGLTPEQIAKRLGLF